MRQWAQTCKSPPTPLHTPGSKTPRLKETHNDYKQRSPVFVLTLGLFVVVVCFLVVVVHLFVIILWSFHVSLWLFCISLWLFYVSLCWFYVILWWFYVILWWFCISPFCLFCFFYMCNEDKIFTDHQRGNSHVTIILETVCRGRKQIKKYLKE